jgi:hypothetical protein
LNRLASVLVLGATLLFAAMPASAQGNPNVTPAGKALGLVMAHGHDAQNGAVAGSGFGNLNYHSGGSVQVSPSGSPRKTYAIYWNPNSAGTFATGYQTTINQYFADVAHDSGLCTNVYCSDTQYYQTVGGSKQYVNYNEAVGGSASVADPPTGTGCTDTSGGTLGCVTDQQLAQEVENVREQNSWPSGSGAEYFVFLASGFSTCMDASHCFASYFCAYHSSYTVTINGSTQTVIYANMPYTGYAPKGCGTGQTPNNNQDADSTINVTSHEANESVTDYLGNAWYDWIGYENGDKCAWKFGTVSGTSGAEYNQTINGRHYYLQGEYSNQDRGCIWTGK